MCCYTVESNEHVMQCKRSWPCCPPKGEVTPFPLKLSGNSALYSRQEPQEGRLGSALWQNMCWLSRPTLPKCCRNANQQNFHQYSVALNASAHAGKHSDLVHSTKHWVAWHCASVFYKHYFIWLMQQSYCISLSNAGPSFTRRPLYLWFDHDYVTCSLESFT